jgi:tetratricopeptide (TPR) repeat protein
VQGLILNKLGQLDAAERTLREALRIRTENLPAKHFMTALTKGALGEVLFSQKKYAEAETLLRESYEDLSHSQAGENQRVMAARNRISALNAVRS